MGGVRLLVILYEFLYQVDNNQTIVKLLEAGETVSSILRILSIITIV